MEEVYSYIYSLAVAASAAGIATALAPDGWQLKKYVKYAASLCMLLLLALPAKNMIAALADGVGQAAAALRSDYSAEYPGGADELVLAKTKANLEESLSELLSAKLGCEKESIEVKVSLETEAEGKIKVSGIGIKAPISAKTIGIEIWLAEQTGCAAKNVVVEWVSSET